MKVAYLAAGAGGMYCGSCMRDNRLAATLIEQGRDVVLLPLYTPIRTDEVDVSQPRVFYGGINAFLQQKFALFRHTPAFVDRLLDAPALLRTALRLAAGTRAEDLGAMTVEVLRGDHGAQRKELQKLIAALRDIGPSLINLPNLMFAGVAGSLKAALGVPIVCTLAGEDIFLDALPQPHRDRALELVRESAANIDAFIAPSRYYATHAAEHFALPADRVHDVPLGVNIDEFPLAHPPEEPFTIGYLARICPEKGLDTLCRAFVKLRTAGRRCRLRVAGYLGQADKPYLDAIRRELETHGATGAFEFVGEVDLPGKVNFLRSLHALSVPTAYVESKGVYVLEALASGVPVVLPRKGSFEELVDATGGGLLYDPAGDDGLETALASMMDDGLMRERMAETGRDAVRQSFNAEIMAEKTWSLYTDLIPGN